MAGRRGTLSTGLYSAERIMDPVSDDLLLPYRWFREEVREDRVEFGRDDGRFAISAVRTGECSSFAVPFLDRYWELRCRQRAGEAAGRVSLGCVTTRRFAVEQMVRYMERLNDIIEGEYDLSPGAMIDLLAERGTAARVETGSRAPRKEVYADELRP